MPRGKRSDLFVGCLAWLAMAVLAPAWTQAQAPSSRVAVLVEAHPAERGTSLLLDIQDTARSMQMEIVSHERIRALRGSSRLTARPGLAEAARALREGLGVERVIAVWVDATGEPVTVELVVADVDRVHSHSFRGPRLEMGSNAQSFLRGLPAPSPIPSPAAETGPQETASEPPVEEPTGAAPLPQPTLPQTPHAAVPERAHRPDTLIAGLAVTTFAYAAAVLASTQHADSAPSASRRLWMPLAGPFLAAARMPDGSSMRWFFLGDGIAQAAGLALAAYGVVKWLMGAEVDEEEESLEQRRERFFRPDDEEVPDSIDPDERRGQRERTPTGSGRLRPLVGVTFAELALTAGVEVQW